MSQSHIVIDRSRLQALLAPSDKYEALYKTCMQDILHGMPTKPLSAAGEEAEEAVKGSSAGTVPLVSSYALATRLGLPRFPGPDTAELRDVSAKPDLFQDAPMASRTDAVSAPAAVQPVPRDLAELYGTQFETFMMDAG